jgi:hypothetical protein
MTPKEKAKELFNKMKGFRVKHSHSKKCALICVDEIIKSNPIIPLQFMLESESLDEARLYWQEVKSELEKL